MTRGMIALVAWPVGVLLALAFSIAMAPGCTANPCALAPEPAWEFLIEVLLAIGPGVAATWWWWRTRRNTQ
jgi:hypothetical protein